jgi:hypothetical protein
MNDTDKYMEDVEEKYNLIMNMMNDEEREFEIKTRIRERNRIMVAADKLDTEVKRLRGLLIKGSEDYTTSYMDLRRIIEEVHWELTGDDHETNEERIKCALIALSEVIE